MIGWHHWLNGHEFEQVLVDGEGHGGLVCFSPRGHKKSDVTEWLNKYNKHRVRFKSELYIYIFFLLYLFFLITEWDLTTCWMLCYNLIVVLFWLYLLNHTWFQSYPIVCIFYHHNPGSLSWYIDISFKSFHVYWMLL